MEQALRLRTGKFAAQEIFEEAAHVLAASRRLGWGGVSLLWHPAAFGEGWLPRDVGDVYWRLAEQRAACGDQWMTAQDYIGAVRQSYVDAGLLPAKEPAPADASCAGDTLTNAAEANLKSSLIDIVPLPRRLLS
jgi:hypothetical protein